MPDDVIRWNEAELAAMARQGYLRRALAIYGGQLGAAAAAAAPHKTGAGAASIHSATVLEGGQWTARISWDQAHAYMRFPELGTRFIRAQHFLKNAVERYTR